MQYLYEVGSKGIFSSNKWTLGLHLVGSGCEFSYNLVRISALWTLFVYMWLENDLVHIVGFLVFVYGLLWSVHSVWQLC